MRVTSVTSSLSSTVSCTDGSVLWGPYTRTPVSQLVNYVTRSDVSRSKVVKGFRPPLPYDAEGYTVSYGFVDLDSRFSLSGKSYHARAFGTTVSTGSPNQVITPSMTRGLISSGARSRLIIELLKRIGDQKWSAGQMIAEMQGSIDMIGDGAKTLSKALNAASRKQWSRVARLLKVKPVGVKEFLKDSASGWLAYSFGWAPIVEDMAQAMLFLSGYTRHDRPIIFAKSAIKEHLVSYRASDCGWGLNGTGAPINRDFGVYYRVKETFWDEYRASLYYELDDSMFRDLQAYGLIGLSTPWAIVPWSFLIDWLVPVGDFLAAVDATIGLNYLGGSETHFRKVLAETNVTGFYGFPYGGATTGTVDFPPANRFFMKRNVFKESPLPFPAYIKNPFSTFKAVTAIALLAQQKL